MSAEQLVPFVVSCNLEPPICRDWTMKNKEDKINLEKTVDRMSEGSSADESEEVEPEPPPAAVRRKVSFADAFGLDLVSVKEYDCRDSSGPQVDGREGEEYHISCLFTIPASIQDMEEKLQQQRLELERIELLHGSTTIRGIVRVLNLSFHKAVYVRATLDGWQSHFDLQAEYVPGSSDGETDCFSFHLVLTPPFQVEGVRVEFCLRYESAVGTFWANNGGTNYIVFFHQRRRSDLKDSEKEKEEESNHKGIRSCLKIISKKIYLQTTPAEASGEISEQVIPMVGRTRKNKTEEEAGTSSCKSLKDCCKTLVDRRRKRQAARLAHVQDYFAKKAMETQRGCKSNTDESTTSIPRPSIPSRSHSSVVHSQQGYSMNTPPILMYHQIPLLPLDWGSTTAASPHANPLDADSKTTQQVDDHLSESTSYTWDASINGSDSTNSHNDIQDQARVPTESLGQSDVLSSKENVAVTLEDKEAEKDCSQVSADRRAMEIIKSDPTEQSKDLSTSPSSDQVVDYKLRKEPRVTTVPCSVLGSKPERVGRESEASCDHQLPHDEHTESLSQALTKASSGEETQTSPNTETKNSEVSDEISTEECTGSLDISKVKENTHRVVKDTLTFTGIRDVLLTNRQAEGSSSDRKDINTDDSEEQVEMRQFYTELHEGDTESSRKGQDETTMDHSTEIQSVSSCEREVFNENELCTSNKNLNKDNSEVQKNEERWFEANEGLKIKERLNETAIEAAKEGEEDEMCSETERELIENSRVVRDNCTDEEKKQPLKATHATNLDIYPRVTIDPSKHLLQATWVVTSPEDDFDLGKTVQNFQEQLDGEDELPTPLPSIHLSWVGANSSRVLSWWQEFGSLGHMAKTLVYAILFVIFITAYLYDMPTCLALYLFSLFWWCSKGLKQRLDGESVDVD